MCSNGLAGVESSKGYCCTNECSACGGKGCGRFGPMCCNSAIEATGRTCSETEESSCFIVSGI